MPAAAHALRQDDRNPSAVGNVKPSSQPPYGTSSLHVQAKRSRRLPEFPLPSVIGRYMLLRRPDRFTAWASLDQVSQSVNFGFRPAKNAAIPSRKSAVAA